MRLARAFFSAEQIEQAGLAVLGGDALNWIVDDRDSERVDQAGAALSRTLERPLPSRVALGDRRSPLGSRPALPALNHFRRTRLGDGRWLASVETGQWVILNDAQMEQFSAMSYGAELGEILERNCLVLTEANCDAHEAQLRRRLFFLREGPTLHIIVVTSKCNLACVYCQASAGSESGASSMTIETALHAVDRIYESPGRSVVIEFQGGEPLLNFPVVRGVIEEAQRRSKARGFRTEFSLISNFTSLLTHDKAAFLIDNGVSVCFSLDGPEDLHDAHRGKGYPRLFRTVVDNVELFRAVWRDRRNDVPRLNALLTVTRSSLPRVESIVRTYVDMGLNRIALRTLSTVGRAKDSDADLGYSASQFLEFWKEGVDIVLRLRAAGVEITETFLELILVKLFAHETGYMDWRSPCGAGIGQIVYNLDGGVYTCDEGRMMRGSEFRMGDVRAPLGSLLDSRNCAETVEASLTEQLFCDYCAFRPYCGICPVLNLSTNGHLLLGVVNGDMCRIRKGMVEHVLHLFEQSPENQALLAAVLDGASLQVM